MATCARFDPFSGVSGNMVLGALLDAGADRRSLLEHLRALPLDGWELYSEKVTRKGLAGTLVRVDCDEERRVRTISDVERIVGEADLPDWVAQRSVEAFRRLAHAESRAHGTSIDNVHFHEVGTVDAVIDVVGSMTGFYLLGVKNFFSSPVATGSGTIECAHGVLPVPAPATVKLLEGVPTVPTVEGVELTTPTGAAILTTLVEDWNSPPPSGVLRTSGMGAGTREVGRANFLRLLLYETREHYGSDVCLEIRTLIDDMDPQLFPELSQALRAKGAVDCYASQCLGKKGRPALDVTVMCPPESRETVLRCLFRESSTMGARVQVIPRVLLDREHRMVTTSYGAVRVKLGRLDGRVVNAEPEYEDCVKVARESGVAVKLVLQEARGEAAEFLDEPETS